MLRNNTLLLTILCTAAICTNSNAAQHTKQKTQKHAHAHKQLSNEELAAMDMRELNQRDQDLSRKLEALLQEDRDPNFVGMHPGRTEPLDQQIIQTGQKLKRVITHRKRKLESTLKQYKNSNTTSDKNHSNGMRIVPR